MDFVARVVLIGDGQNTDIDYPNGLPNWRILKWTILENNNPNEHYSMFLAANIVKLHLTSANVHPVQPLATRGSPLTSKIVWR